MGDADQPLPEPRHGPAGGLRRQSPRFSSPGLNIAFPIQLTTLTMIEVQNAAQKPRTDMPGRKAATHDAAIAMGVGHESGTLAPGKYADVIAVRGDLLRHPDLLQFVDIVIKRGRRVR